MLQRVAEAGQDSSSAPSAQAPSAAAPAAATSISVSISNLPPRNDANASRSVKIPPKKYAAT
jgi:hypothetical protein